MADDKKPSLADLTYYANRSQGGVGAEELSTARARDALAAAQAYDPGASWRPVYGSDGQSLGYTLDFDASKLPGVGGTGLLGGTSGHGSGADYQIPFSTVQPNMHLANADAVTSSPVYGKVTDNRNIQQQDDWIAKWGGPALVAAFAFGAPALASLMSNGAIGAGAAGAAGGAGGSVGGATGAGVGDGSLLPMIPTDPASLYTPMLPFNPADPTLALNGVTPAMAAGIEQAAAPIVEAGTPARVGDVIRSGHFPGIDNLATSARELFAHPMDLLTNASKLVTNAPGGGAGGGARGGMSGVAGGLFGAGPGEDATSILARFYGIQNINPLLDPRLRALKGDH